MKHIDKQDAPEDLEEYKRLPGACFRDLPKEEKNNLRDSLFIEQGGVCCYCVGKIRNKKTVIEHFKPKAEGKYPELQLEYSNLLLSCDGGQRERSKHNRRENKLYPLYCDANKGEEEIFVSPLSIDCEEQFYYGDEGEIFGNSEEAKRTIEILNLDIPYLRNRRKEAIAVYKELELEREQWEEEIADLLSKNQEGDFIPYCTAVVSYIVNYIL